MRQVPRYLIIGNGRMAQYICHYFSALNLSFHQWSRKNPSKECFARCTKRCNARAPVDF